MKTRVFNRHLAALLVLLLAGSSMPAFAQTLQLVSAPDSSQIATAGGGGDSGAPVISPDGHYVLFASAAGNLVLSTNNTAFQPRFPTTLNVFLRDRTNGTTTLVSVNLTGTSGGNGDSLPVDLSTNGHYAVFESSASDLVLGDTNGVTDIFVRDLQAVVTTLASVGAALVSTSSGSESPDITPDGRYVAFSSTATNLVAGVPNAQDIYVRDLVGGTTIWASTGAGAAALSVLNATRVVCCNHAISADGKFVAYEASTLYHS